MELASHVNVPTGLKITVFLSDYCIVRSMRDGKYIEFRFEHGHLVDEKRGKCKESGTVITYRLSDKVFKRIKDIDINRIKNVCYEKSLIFPDIKFKVIGMKKDKEIINLTFKDNNMIDKIKSFSPDTEVVHLSGKHTMKYDFDRHLSDGSIVKSEEVLIEAAFAFKEEIIDVADPEREYKISYTNTINNHKGGYHADGTEDGIYRFFKKVITEKYMSKKEKEELNITPTDVTSSLIYFTWVQMHAPEFRGQFKDMLNTEEAKKVMSDFIYKKLLDEKESVIKKMAEHIKNVAKSRLVSKKARKPKNVSNAFSKDKINKWFPFVKTVKTTRPAFYMVEGDSAKDAVLPARDKYNDGIYCITGKPENLIDSTYSQIMRIESTFREMVDIWGCGMGKDFDESKLLFDEINMFCDADCDGKSMIMNILGMIYLQCPDLIYHGYVNIIEPPLYSIEEKKKKIFFSSQRDLFAFVQKRFSKDNKVFRFRSDMTDDDMGRFLDFNIEYTSKVEKVSKRYTADPLLIEDIAINFRRGKETDLKYWKGVISKYKDLSVKMDNNNILITGFIGSSPEHIPFDDYFKNKIRELRHIQECNLVVSGYKINGKGNYTIYEVMKTVESYMPGDISRYKGLNKALDSLIAGTSLKLNILNVA